MPHRAPTLPISLFLPYYTPKHFERAAELLGCLKRNLDCGAFSQIFLLQDDDTPRPFNDTRLKIIRLPRRPTYLDWVIQSRLLCPQHISVLANSDIWFDNNIELLRAIFAADGKSFVALSRYDAVDGVLRPHENPHWSQDTWAFHPGQDMTPSLLKQLDIPLGIPRCDNKVAFVFSVNGYTVFNPFHEITSVHQHETNLRYYDKTGDTTIMGGMAMVHPSKDLLSPAPLDIQIWSLNSKHYQSCKVNAIPEKWAAERAAKAQASQGVFGLDAHWQYPAITEQHAFRQMRRLLPEDGTRPGTVYIGFPWATLVDLKVHQARQVGRIESLEAALKALVTQIGQQERVMTVCQHIRMLQFPDLFAEAGVTDIYWPHATWDQPVFPGAPGITLHPFPLFPVQQAPTQFTDLGLPRPHLFSFVGAGSGAAYLSQARNWILDELAGDPRGVVIRREIWHYNRIVYDRQILNKHRVNGALIDQDASDEFQRTMRRTIFSLCPSGSGPNSIRLWEAALNGSIPVVLADTYRHPGDAALWATATVPCRETPEDIRALPDRLAAIASDPELLHRKRIALYLLTRKYGPDRFVHDILAQMRPDLIDCTE